MSIGQYLLGGAAGLVFGLLVAAGNTLLLRRSLQRAKQDKTTVMGTLLKLWATRLNNK